MFTLKHIDDLRSKPISSRNFRHRDSKLTKWICTLDSIVRQSSYPPTKTAFCTDSKSLSKHSNFKSSIYKRVLHLVSIISLAVSWGEMHHLPRSPNPQNLLSSAGWWESHLNLCLEFAWGNPKGISHLPILVVQPVSCRKAES